MPGRRGARSGRGWDAIPPRPADENPPPGGEPRDGDPERGNVPGRRRGSSGNFSPAVGGSGSSGGYGRRSGSSRRSGRSFGSAPDSDEGQSFGASGTSEQAHDPDPSHGPQSLPSSPEIFVVALTMPPASP